MSLPVSPSNLTLSAECERRVVATEVSSQRTIEWTVGASELQQRVERAPLNLALVLDRSGSMHGDKLRYVQQAACHILDLLDERDRVAVVAYDDMINVISRSTPVSQSIRESLKRQINALQPGGSTNLSGGWLQGCSEVASFLSTAGVNRALLLTDGLANVGIVDIEELTRHARELRRRGVSTSTFGVGLDFNEHLLSTLAEQGGGHFYYIERPAQIPSVFRDELGELLTVVAREATLTIAIPRGVAVEVLGDIQNERVNDQIRIFLGELSAGQRRMLYTRILTPPDAVGTTIVVRGELTYANLGDKLETAVTDIAFNYMREAEVLLEPLYEPVLSRAAEVEMAGATARALKMEREGKRKEAQQVLQQTLAANAPYMPAPTAASYTQLAEQIESGHLSETDRKARHYDSYQSRQSRKKP